MINRALNFGFLIVFVAGGWSPLLAAVFCPHGDCGRVGHGVRLEPAALSQKHQAAEHTQSPHPCHGGMAAEAEPSTAPSTVTTGTRSFDHTEFLQLTDLGGRCGHCLTRSPVPGGDSLRLATPNPRRGQQQEITAPAAFSFAAGVPTEIASFPARTPTQGAPPAFLQRLDSQRHLLLATFLI